MYPRLKHCYRGPPRYVGEKRNMILYFKRTRDILGLNLTEQVISLQLKGTLSEKKIKGAVEYLIRNKGEKVKFSRDQVKKRTPPSP